MAYEAPLFEKILEEGAFSIRRYPFFKTVVMHHSSWDGYSGFNDLFNYISGQNKQRQAMKMTVPVINDVQRDQLSMEFVVPAQFYDNTPEPSVNYLSLKTYENMHLGVIHFRGNPSRMLIEKHYQSLLEWLQQKGYQPSPSYFVARYNAPFMPGLFKHNEVWIRLDTFDKDHKTVVDDRQS